MRTLPWRKKEEEVQWIKHEKTQLRIKREEREESLSAMGYLVRVCTSLLGLKISGFFQLLLLKVSHAWSKTFGWISNQFPAYISSISSRIRSSLTKFALSISQALGAMLSAGKWIFTSLDGLMNALGTMVINGTKKVYHAFKAVLVRLVPGFGNVFGTIFSQSGQAVRSITSSIASSVRGFGVNSQNMTTLISRRVTQKLVNHRKILAYSALSLAAIGGVIAAVSMGVFSQFLKTTEIAGVGRIIDADLIKVGDTDIRLFGIDAPEPTQRCKRNARGRSNWGCGRKAVTQLSNLVNNNQVTCTRKGTDDLGRIQAKCKVEKWDLAAYMVREGLAWVSPGDPAGYAKFETAAKDAAVGIWRAKNDTPWNYREARWTEAKARAPEGCPVKGNISGAGRVYYMPWSNQYDRVHIQLKKGERWFCNEREAMQAGWRMTRYP